MEDFTESQKSSEDSIVRRFDAIAYPPAVQRTRARSTPIIMFADEMRLRILAIRMVRLMAKLEDKVYFVTLARSSLKSESLWGSVHCKVGP